MDETRGTDRRTRLRGGDGESLDGGLMGGEQEEGGT